MTYPSSLLDKDLMVVPSKSFFLRMGCILQFSMVISLKTVLSRKLFILFHYSKFPALISLDSLLLLLPANCLGSMDT